jgi:hypothetical protein
MQGANHESVSGRVLVDVVSCSPVRVPLRTALQGVSGKYLAGDLDIHLTPFYACISHALLLERTTLRSGESHRSHELPEVSRHGSPVKSRAAERN